MTSLSCRFYIATDAKFTTIAAHHCTLLHAAGSLGLRLNRPAVCNTSAALRLFGLASRTVRPPIIDAAVNPVIDKLVEFGRFLRGIIFPKDWRYGGRDLRSL
jgi:hypothetical protein